MKTQLSKRVALVTGASSGIGKAAALALAAAGVKVAVTARRADRLEVLVNKIKEAGGEAIALPGDIIDEAFARDIVEQTVKHFGCLDMLVNSAGMVAFDGVENADIDQWHHVMNLNFFATLAVCTAAIPHMRKQGGGDMINISSTAGRRAASALGSYAASKFALNGMSEGLRQEIGGYGIRVCIIEPGATTTEVYESIEDPGKREFMRNHVAKEGAMKPEDIADTIVFIVSLPSRVNIPEILILPTIDTKPI